MSGFDSADFWCGRCGRYAFTGATEVEYPKLYALHQEAHYLADQMTDDQKAALLRAAEKE